MAQSDLNEVGFSSILQDCDTFKEALTTCGAIDNVYLEVGHTLYSLTVILSKYDYVAISDELIQVADGYSLTTTVDDESNIADDKSWDYFERLFIKRCTLNNVVITTKHTLAKLILAGKDDAASRREGTLMEITQAVDDFIENM